MGGVAAKRQPSVRTDDSAAEVSLEYLPTPLQGAAGEERKSLDSSPSGQNDHTETHT